MGKQQKKFQKRKDRERQVRKKVLRRRDILRARREEEEAKDREVEEAGRSKQTPIVSNPKKKDEMIKKKLAQNMKVLEALEQEYLKEMEARRERNEELESLGFDTLGEKVQALTGMQVINEGGGRAEATVIRKGENNSPPA